MEDGKIIFRAKTPWGVVEPRVYANIKAFNDEMDNEKQLWKDFPAFGDRQLWNPQVAFNEFLQQISPACHSARMLTERIDTYYSNNKLDIRNCYYPSWTFAGRILLKNKTNSEFLAGFYDGFYERGDSHYSHYTMPRMGGVSLAYTLRHGLSTSSPENALEEMQAIREQHAQLMKEAIESKNRMEKLYNEKLHLEAAVTYWGDKAAKHEQQKKFWMWSIGIWSVISLVVLGVYLKWGGSFYKETIKIFVDEQWSFVCGFLILASFVYWVIRFVVSQYNQHNHLATDARERETMAKTFLALVNDEKANGTVTEKDHLGLVLAALFRPSAVGGCDNGPVPFYEVVANTLSKK